MTRRVIAAIDCAPVSREVVRWADAQAREHGGDLLVATAWPPARRLDLACTAAARDEVARIVAAALPPSRAARAAVHAVPDPVVDALVRCARPDDLVVIGRSAPKRIRRRISTRLAAALPCPVVVVGQDTAAATTGRIVVGVDGSPASLAALHWASEYARESGDHVVAVTAWRWRPELPDEPPAEPEQRLHEHEAQRLLSDAVTDLPGAESVERRLVWGSPIAVLEDEAERADLLVLGASGAGSVQGLVFGSVSRHFAADCARPVVLVQPDANRAGGRTLVGSHR